ncbi:MULTISPECIES: NEL-type E3 ubiquitin ligase domain-containing protein [unclassified Pseudomonas]|uniref:NEL-type E3 ubiquitin ligase domain-containing protein n=1 Tax=unclassified Pseudomonas TaxID=196821 RepID=UPI001CCC9550|nr:MULTISPECIES: NEL-type E3 ubiquitin ligase domain-containing protein [unclassified Pseudomonas]
MSAKNSTTVLPTMTPEQQGAFFSVVKQQMPGWVLGASSEVRAALRKSLMASFVSRAAASATLRKLQSPEKYCRPLLETAFSEKLHMPCETTGVVFQHIRSISSLLKLRKKLVTPIGRDLLLAACENFEASEARSDNYDGNSLIYIPERITGRTNKILQIKPEEFAKLCRSLDLGKQYQDHINTIFKEDNLHDKYVAFAKDQFEVDVHIAFMKKHISADVYTLLKAVRRGDVPLKLGNNTPGYQRLEMRGLTLHGAMFVGPVTEPADEDYRCVVYLPGDPLHPIKEYSSFTKFETELSRRLRTADFRKFFMRFILLSEQPGFLAFLTSRLLNPNSGGLPLPVSARYISLDGFDIKEEVFSLMYQQRSAHVLADARLLVVPTDDEDEKTRLDRLETYKTIGLNTLLFLSSFVPVVGEVMFAIAGIQLLAEVYEGIESWTQGEQEQATDYMFDVIENLMLMAAMAGAGKAAGKGFKTMKSSSLIGRLRSVPVGTAPTKLWKPDLKAYQQTSSVPGSLAADAKGLVTWRERQYMRAGTDLFAIRPIKGTDLWKVEHPTSPERYSPVMETNGVGAWRHDSELPQKWNLLTLFRRLGYREEEFSDSESAQILATSAIDEQQLRQLFLDRARPMATLVDTVRRFRADKDVSHFVESMRTPLSAPQADPDLQLYLLTEMGRWPKDVSISIRNTGGSEVSHYGSVSAPRQITLANDLLEKGQFYPALLSALRGEERTRLLGLTTTDAASQAQALSKVLAEQSESKKLPLFARVYQRLDVSTEPRAAVIREKFADLPFSVADELVHNADFSEWQELDNAIVPLRLVEEARRYAQVVRLNRAYEGLYLDAAGGLDSDRLVLNTVKHLPGWTNDVFVEITEWALHSEKKASIGTTDADNKLFIEAYPNKFKATDGHNKVLATHLQRTRAHFFQTLWEGLPVSARKALGVEANDAGVGLRKKITELALKRRDAIALAIGIKSQRTGYRSPMGLADRLIVDATLLGLPPASKHSAALVQRAQELYPSHSPALIEHFLTTLGSDDVLVTRKLEAMRQELQTIRFALERWINRPTHYQEGDGPRLKVPRHSKERAAHSILRAWRKETGLTPDMPETLYILRLDPQPLGELPMIVGDFSHVGTLEMDSVGTSAGFIRFLHNFANLRTLSLTRNQLTRVPQAIAAMSRLRSLDLSDNQIQLTPEAVQWLGNRDQLHALDLSFNPALGRTPDVSALRQLQRLALRGTKIVEWPVGAHALSTLRTLDLRDNLIAQIPQAVFSAEPALNRGTNVDGNPFSTSSLREIAEYQRSSGISLGILAAEYHQVAAVQPDSARRGSIWMRGLTGDALASRQALWDSLSAYPWSRDFFHLLAQMHDTAEFNLLQIDLSRRVWNVLEAAGEDDMLRRTLFRMARIGRVGAENVSGQFSDIEVRVLCFRAVHAARTGNRTLEGELVHLMRGLFRLQEVERQAMIEIGRRTLVGPMTHAQAQELSLIYRVRLARRLDLPAQPREMNFIQNVDVTPAQLQHAYEEVVKAEADDALLTSFNNRIFWYEYLVATYPADFDAITQRSAQAFREFEVQENLQRAEASQRLKAIVENFKNENARLVQRLTSAALARHPAVTLPAEEVA